MNVMLFCKRSFSLNKLIRYYNDVLRGLYPLFEESESDNAVRDNAAGAVARMIMVHPECIPLNQVCFLVLEIFRFFLKINNHCFGSTIFYLILGLPGTSCVLESSSFKRRSRGVDGCL